MKWCCLCSAGDLQDISQGILRASVDEGLKILEPCKWDSHNGSAIWGEMCVCVCVCLIQKEKLLSVGQGCQVIYNLFVNHRLFVATEVSHLRLLCWLGLHFYILQKKIFAVGKVGCAQSTQASRLSFKIKMYSFEYSQWWQVDVFKG